MSRTAAEGLVLFRESNELAIIEINSETDFSKK